MYYTIKMGDNRDICVDVSPDVIEMLKQLNMYDVLMNRFLGSGEAVRAMTDEWEMFHTYIHFMIYGLPAQDRRYAVNHGGYPMQSVFLAKTCVAFMNEVAEEGKKDDALFDNKFNGLLTKDVFQRWLKRLKKTANKVLGDVLTKKTELYFVVISKIIEKTTQEMSENEGDKAQLIEKLSEKLEGVLKCVYAESDSFEMAKEINHKLWADGYRIDLANNRIGSANNRTGFDIFAVK